MIYSTTENLFLYIKQQMLADKISVSELAARMNKSQSTVSTTLRQNNVTLITLNDICNALGYDLEINLIKKDMTADQEEAYYNVALAARNETLNMNKEQRELFAKSANNAPNNSRNHDMF